MLGVDVWLFLYRCVEGALNAVVDLGLFYLALSSKFQMVGNKLVGNSEEWVKGSVLCLFRVTEDLA